MKKIKLRLRRPECMLVCVHFSYVRVDLYELDNGELKFGEMTFTPASGMDCWSPKTADILLGRLIHLPKKFNGK